MDLPPKTCRRWTPSRKAAVVDAVRTGMLSLPQVMEDYGLTAEEYILWEDAIRQQGPSALRVTKLQHRRKPWIGEASTPDSQT